MRQEVWIGNSSEKGIYHYQLKRGKLRFINMTRDVTHATYLTQSKTHLYSVIEIPQDKKQGDGFIVAYKKVSNQLVHIDQQSSFGKGPCYIEMDTKHKLLLVSNYIDGYLTIFKLQENGKIGEKLYHRVENRKVSHVHCTIFFSSNTFFMIDLGADLLIAYELKEDKIQEITRVSFPKHTEPRHIVYRKDKLYVITEKSCKIYIIEWKERKLNIIGDTDMISQGDHKTSEDTGCAIKISKDGKYLYATLRGKNRIMVYQIKKDTLKRIQDISCQGDTPRDLAIDKTNHYVLVANQNSDEVAIFRRNRMTGKLQFKQKENITTPTCIII